MSPRRLTEQQQAYQKKSRDIAEFKRLMDAEAREAAKRLHDRFPQFKELGTQSNTRVFIRTPAGQGKTKAILAIVDILVNDLTASKKQVDVLREVQSQFPDIKLLPNIWNTELHPAVLKKAKERVDGGMMKPISIHGLKKLSEIRKALYASRKIEGALQTFKKTISISKTEVVVGQTTYPVQVRNKGKPSQKRAIRVTVDGNRREWINLAPLYAMLLEN